jgi:hypothetical protein
VAEWVPLNAVVEKDDDADPASPWYPCLFADGMSTSLNVWFASEAECREFIRESVVPAREA